MIISLPWYVWILMANASIFFVENMYRSSRFESFWAAIPWITVPIVLGQIGLFYGFRAGGASTLLQAAILFSMVNLVLRVANTVILGEPLGWKMAVAVGLMGVSAILVSLKN